uniref:CASP-like protein n=1 Tax=Chenopodium quinoa TaxID=63459 RepID=A0A803L8M9_CHEQI
MAADRTQGWSGDSFDRYKEYSSSDSKGKLKDFRWQILAYLLISASSAAASRVDDWQANWGKDEFTEKASASISMAFLAFLGFAMSSLISGYNLCNRDLP